MNQNPKIDFSKMKAPGMFHVAGWLLLLGCAVMLWDSIPGVFPETIRIARTALVIGLLGASILIGLTCYGAGKAKTLAGVLGVACTLTMIANVSSHWLMARALNVAYVNETQAREEQDQASKLANEDAERRIKLMGAEAGLVKANAQADTAAAQLYRQTGVKPVTKRAPKVAVTPTPPVVEPTPKPKTDAFGQVEKAEQPHYETRKEVFASWAWFCSILAILDLLLPVGGVAFCIFRWELDLNRDGIADRLQTTPGK